MTFDLSEYEKALQISQNDVMKLKEGEKLLQQDMVATMFSSEYNENLVRWQLDIKEELERIEHLLRKHIPKRGPNGEDYFVAAPKEDQLFNEHGINFILNLLGWYLNKNFILSNFDEEQINLRVHQFATRLIDYVHNNYEQMGLNTADKLKEVPMIIMNLVNTVEATYNRALGGGERESLRTARTVHQTEPIGGYQGIGQNQPINQAKGFSLMNPKTWGKS